MVPVTLPNGYVSGDALSQTIWLRPWSGADELAIAADADAPPAAGATTLLARCVHLADGRRAGRAFVRALTAGDREALLLHLRRLALGDRLSCVLACPSCEELMDLDLDAARLLVAPAPTPRASYDARIEDDDRVLIVMFRLPTGADQEDAVPLARRDPAAAARAVIDRCVERCLDEATGAPWPPSDAACERLSALMAERDPQAEILLDAACPACGAAVTTVFDGAGFLQQEIRQHAASLFRQVHLLASHYHWSERDILRLSARRRRRYLDLIAAGQSHAGSSV